MNRWSFNSTRHGVVELLSREFTSTQFTSHYQLLSSTNFRNLTSRPNITAKYCISRRKKFSPRFSTLQCRGKNNFQLILKLHKSWWSEFVYFLFSFALARPFALINIFLFALMYNGRWECWKIYSLHNDQHQHKLKAEISSPFPWVDLQEGKLLFSTFAMLSFAITRQSALLFRICTIFLCWFIECILHWLSKLPQIIDARMFNKLDGWKKWCQRLVKVLAARNEIIPLQLKHQSQRFKWWISAAN